MSAAGAVPAGGPRAAGPASAIPASLAPAYAECLALAGAHYENFPVASRLLPPAMRPHVAALYAFARTADDIADEGTVPAESRLAALEAWRERVWRAAEGHRLIAGDPSWLPALGHTISTLRLPLPLFDDLLSAFSQDVTTTRYATWTEVFDYCRRSANPVGRLVLRVAGYTDGALDPSSDALCTALQLTNFWQDLRIDWTRGRLYVPREEWDATGAEERDLDRASLGPEWRLALENAAARTRACFDEGREVCARVGGRLGYELRVTWLGGLAVLDKLAAGGYDPLVDRPRLTRRDVPGLLWRAWRWQGATVKG